MGMQTQTVWRYRSIRSNNAYQWISLLFRHVDNKTKTNANHKHLHVSWTIRVSKLIGFYIVHQLWVCHLLLVVNLTKSFSFNMFTYLINQYLRFKIGTAFTKHSDVIAWLRKWNMYTTSHTVWTWHNKAVLLSCDVMRVQKISECLYVIMYFKERMIYRIMLFTYTAVQRFSICANAWNVLFCN